jgi:hypothetical protein
MAKGDDTMNFTQEELLLLMRIAEGADILGLHQAILLRDIKERHPELLIITEPQGNYKTTEKRPYFGAILTDIGTIAVADSMNRLVK